MAPAETTPVLVGAAQITAREPDPERTPIGLIAEAARAAAADCGVTGVLGQVQSLTCLNILAPAYPDAPASLAQRLGIEPGERFYTPIGGNMGQWLVGYYADRIAAGELDCALIAGGEALATQMRGKDAGLSGVPDTATGEGPQLLGDDREPTNATEHRHGLDLPIQIYPLFEQALRGRYGHGPVEHRRILGELYARFNAVIETYTVMHDRADRPVQGIVLGRLSDGRRFLANTPNDTDLLDAMTNEAFLDRTGGVRNDGKRNLFSPQG